MSGACFFSKLDASSGYWQIKVGEESSHLSAFGTSLGRCRIKRLPYDVLVSIDLWTICFTMSHILVPSEKRLSFLYRDIVSLNYMLPCMVLMEKNEKIINQIEDVMHFVLICKIKNGPQMFRHINGFCFHSGYCVFRRFYQPDCLDFQNLVFLDSFLRTLHNNVTLQKSNLP